MVVSSFPIKKRRKIPMMCFKLYTLSFLTGESFYFDCAFMRTESSACNFMYLMIGRIFYRLASDLIPFKPCHIMIQLETLLLHVM